MISKSPMGIKSFFKIFMSESTINVTKWILDDPPNSNSTIDKITSLGTKVEQKNWRKFLWKS
jgi:hypothetical protein